MKDKPTEGTAMSTEKPSAITRDEWKRRYAARIMERADWPEMAAIDASEVAAQEFERMERAAGNAIDWNAECPEWAADEEMSYWENDGE
jgi:ribose 1,5-bisphosphokinase PhnN